MTRLNLVFVDALEIPSDEEIENHFEHYQEKSPEGTLRVNPLRILFIALFVLFVYYLIYAELFNSRNDNRYLWGFSGTLFFLIILVYFQLSRKINELEHKLKPQ